MKKKKKANQKQNEVESTNTKENSFAVQDLQTAEGKPDKDVKPQESVAGDKKEEEKPPFVTYGGHVVLTQEENIVYYKIRYKFLTAMFKLVGRFNSKGGYEIGDEVKRELVNMCKEISFSNVDGYKAHSLFLGKNFEFSIKIVGEEEGKLKASLYLEEYVGETLEEKYIVSHIADYVDVNDDNFRIKVRKVFNLTDVALPISEFDVPNSCIILQRRLDLDLVVGDLFDMASQIYLIRILKLLEEFPEGREIIARYKSFLNGDENEIKYKFSYLRLLLERAIDEHGGFEVLGLKKEDKKKLIDDLLLSIQNMKKKTEDEKVTVVEAPKSDSKKSAGKPSAKKPEKKASKKKDDKKDKKKPAKKKDKKDTKAKKTDFSIVFYIEEPEKEKPKKESVKKGETSKAQNKNIKKSEPQKPKENDTKTPKDILRKRGEPTRLTMFEELAEPILEEPKNENLVIMFGTNSLEKDSSIMFKTGKEQGKISEETSTVDVVVEKNMIEINVDTKDETKDMLTISPELFDDDIERE